jgi:hypothetical protein
MSEFDLDVWVSKEFPSGWTHIIKGDFVNPQAATQAATDLFCYDQNTGIGAFFATVKNGRLDDGTPVPDGPHKIGGNHTFSRLWTHITHVPQAGARYILFYDAISGIGEVHETDGRGGLRLKSQQQIVRGIIYTHVIGGRFGSNNVFFYRADRGKCSFYRVNNAGGIGSASLRELNFLRDLGQIVITGNFSSSPNDDLLFYNRSLGVGEFYKVHDIIEVHPFARHTIWRRSWKHIVSGQFLQNAPFDGLLFFEDGTSFTEFYSTNGQGAITHIDIDPGNQWHLPWQAILAGQYAPNLGIIGNSSLCAYHPDGAIRYFFIDRSRIRTVIDLNGQWTDGSPRRAVISSAFNSLTVDMSAFHRPAAHGSILNSSTISVTFPDDRSFTGTLQPPNTIRWSNSTVWRRVGSVGS